MPQQRRIHYCTCSQVILEIQISSIPTHTETLEEEKISGHNTLSVNKLEIQTKFWHSALLAFDEYTASACV